MSSFSLIHLTLSNLLHLPSFSYPKAGALVIVLFFFVSSTSPETIRSDEGTQQPQVRQNSLYLAASDLVKSAFCLFVWFVWRRVRPSTASAAEPTCDPCEAWLPMNRQTGDGPFRDQWERHPVPIWSCPHCGEPHPRSRVIFILGSVRSTVSVFAIALVHTLHGYTDLRARQFIHPFTLPLASPVTILVVLAFVRIVSSRTFPSSFWHAAALQFAGFLIARDAVMGPVSPPYGLLVAFALCNSMWISLVEMVYGLHRSSSAYLINSMMFAISCLIHFLLFVSDPSHIVQYPYSYHNRLLSAFPGIPLTQAAKDITTLFLIQQYGAVNQGILTSLASTLSIIADAWKAVAIPSPASLGCLIAIFGCGMFILYREYHDPHEHIHNLLISGYRRIAAATVSLATLGYILIAISRNSAMEISDSWKVLSGSSSNHSTCRVPQSSALQLAKTIGNYTHFNTTLLIVFFSHARYDANLDFYKEVYADYFPNIVYIGPASREDKGFAHSYDVLVDSFQSDEDLNDPLFYKMAGRMAHHMLYTALREYDCYDGYLWAPFDTFLNVPRLQQFNQSLFWYHSPWGQPVGNPALGEPAELVLNVSQHAPPAMISPDPSINLTETWRGWGPDWWWGDPHVGVSVCMTAFHEVPEVMRARLAERTNGQTRLIGGSVDTLYIPGRYRTVFMDVLALFLETDCFLEIATPTTIHLVVPPGEPIEFVDHWWIYQPPFDTSFVRQKWGEGYEVDTFHTFHWGERGHDGSWRGDHRRVGNVRHLLRESAHRQGLDDMFPVRVDENEDHGTMQLT